MKKAVTLIELIVSMVVVGIIMLGISVYLIQAVDTWNFLSYRSDVVGQIRLGLIRMGRDIRQLTSVEAVSDDSFYFLRGLDASQTGIRYRYDAGTDEVFYEEDTDLDGSFASEPSYVLMDGVTSFDFDYFDNTSNSTTTPAAVYRVRITTQLQNRGETLGLAYDVFPRSLKY